MTFSIGLIRWTDALFSPFAFVGHCAIFSKFAVVGHDAYSIGLLSLDAAVFHRFAVVGDRALFPRFAVLGHDVFPFGLVGRLRELVAASHCGLMQINHQLLIGHNVNKGHFAPLLRGD